MRTRSTLLLSVAALCGFLLVSCEEEGPAEQAGEKIDETIEKAGDAVEKATD